MACGTAQICRRNLHIATTTILDENENYVTVNGDRIAAGCGNTPGNRTVMILCQEEDNPQYHLGEAIYTFRFVSCSDTEFVLEDDDGTQYIFVKVGNTPKKD